MLPASFAFMPTLLKEYHATLVGGHSGFNKMYKLISPNFFWKGMKQAIMAYICECDICSHNKYQAMSPVGVTMTSPNP